MNTIESGIVGAVDAAIYVGKKTFNAAAYVGKKTVYPCVIAPLAADVSSGVLSGTKNVLKRITGVNNKENILKLLSQDKLERKKDANGRVTVTFTPRTVPAGRTIVGELGRGTAKLAMLGILAWGGVSKLAYTEKSCFQKICETAMNTTSTVVGTTARIGWSTLKPVAGVVGNAIKSNVGNAAAALVIGASLYSAGRHAYDMGSAPDMKSALYSGAKAVGAFAIAGIAATAAAYNNGWVK